MAPSPKRTTEITRFGKYELLDYLGGGMADVYRARDTVTGKIVAIKILKPANAADDEIKARFLEEARTAAPLDHPHVINVFDFGEVDGLPYMVMEFLHGQDLRGYIRSGRTGDIIAKLRAAVQLAEALEYIHANNIIHRDIKPDNVHIDTDGLVRLIDFGIAKSDLCSVKTRAGFAVGTVAYMAPEQLIGENTKLVDVYAFGLVLFELLTGIKVIEVEGATNQQVFYRIQAEPVDTEPLRQVGTPASVIHLIERCTAKEPKYRPQSFSKIRQELQEAIQEVTGPINVPVVVPLGWRWMYISGAVLAAVVLTVWLAFRHPKGNAPTTTSSVETSSVSQPKPLPTTIHDPAGVMVLVPAGPFRFEEHELDQPAAPIVKSLPNFYIDRTEVTNGVYIRYGKGRRAAVPAGRSEYPVVNVTAKEAQAFCEAVGKRLPTKFEWEKAARGADDRRYPWGDQAEPSRANVSDNSGSHLLPAEAVLEGGASPSGALHMAGNVWEFVSDSRLPNRNEVQYWSQFGHADQSKLWPLVFGGSWKRSLISAALWDPAVIPPNEKQADLGFRCAKSVAGR